MARRLRAFDWVLIVALTGSWGLLFARTLVDGVRSGRAGVCVAASSAPAADAYPTVIQLWSSMPSGPALEPGDEILAIDGEDLAGASALRFYGRTGRAARTHGFARAEVRRGGQEPFEARLELTPMPLWWIFLPVSAGLILTALLLLVRAPGWHLKRRYFVACWCFAVLYPTLGPTPRSSFEALALLLFPFGAGLTIWNAQDFTPSARPVPPLHRVVALGVALVSLVWVLARFFVAQPQSVVAALLLASNLSFVAASLAGLTRAYRRSDPLERRQLRWVVLGFYVTFIGLAASAFGEFVGIRPEWRMPMTAFLALGVPSGILISVLGYRLFDVDLAISAAASYTIVGLAVLGAALAVVPRLAHAGAPAIGLDPAAGQWLLTMALVGAAIPVHRALRPRIDRRLFAERHERMAGFERLLDEIGACTSVEDLTRLPGERMDALLEPESIAIYGREETVFTPLFVRGRAAPPAFDTDSLLVRALERRGRPLAADAAELDAFDRAALETLGVAVVVPIRGRQNVAAFTCLGRKRSGDIYTPEEIAYLAAVANRCSEVLLKLDDEVVLREARELQHSLRRYVPGAVAEELASGRDLEPGEREVSVMFVDIRGYTRFAERRAPDEVFSTLNAYTERVSRLVRERGGSVVEFHGDGLMAVFGAPRPLERKERAAVEAAREVVEALAGNLAVGIGIATGPAFVGSLRAADRLIWSAIGNTTNLAARLQSLTRDLGAAIAVDEATRAAAGYLCADFEHHADVPIRGRSERQDVWVLPLARGST